MKNLVKKSMMLLAGVLILATSCNQPNDSIDGGKGTVVLKLTDAPFPVSLVAQVMVTIDKIEIRSTPAQVTTVDETGNQTLFTVLSEKEQQFNLLDLRNGITADLLELEIGVGSYDMIRMHVVAAKVILNDGNEFDMKIPSGSTSGLKIKLSPELVVESGVVNEVIVDFDISKSFVVQGSMMSPHGIKGFIFKPVIRAMCERQSGRIEGTVFENETTPVNEAHVQIMLGDSIYSSALTDENGAYALIGIPVGSYQVICEKEGYIPVQVDGVVVKRAEKTVQDFILTK